MSEALRLIHYFSTLRSEEMVRDLGLSNAPLARIITIEEFLRMVFASLLSMHTNTTDCMLWRRC